MKTVLFSLVCAFCCATISPSFAITSAMNGESTVAQWTSVTNVDPNAQALSPEMLQMSLNKFLTLTPSKYKEMTGKRLGLKNSLALKAAQKVMKSKVAGTPEVSKGIYILLAILGWGFLGIGLLTDWKGNDWLYCLLLGFLCWLPGVIYAFSKMKNYYS